MFPVGAYNGKIFKDACFLGPKIKVQTKIR